MFGPKIAMTLTDWHLYQGATSDLFGPGGERSIPAGETREDG